MNLPLLFAPSQVFFFFRISQAPHYMRAQRMSRKWTDPLKPKPKVGLAKRHVTTVLIDSR